MRKLLNTLYVTIPDAYLAKEGQNVLVKVNDEIRFRMPIHNLEGIVHFGYTGASPQLMAFCAENNVGLTFCTEHGRFLARVTGRVRGNVHLRRTQYRLADNEEACLAIATTAIIGKVANCRTVLQRALRNHPERLKNIKLENTIKRMGSILDELLLAPSLDTLRGLEGDSARLYFSALDHLIMHNKQTFFMRKRSRRPPLDPFNGLLSFLYTLLTSQCASALETTGLDPAVGFLHKDRPGRPSLALDIMEELRPYLADRLAISLINRNQIKSTGFKRQESGSVVMDDETRRAVLQAWQERKQDKIIHPYLKEEISVGLLPYVQALLLARYIRGDIDGYPAFVFR